MFSSQTADISLKAPIRALEAVRGDQVEARFVVGTCSVQQEQPNHLHVLRYHGDANQWITDAVLHHDHPILKVVTNPTDKTSLLTLSQDSSEVTLYKLPTEVMDRTGDVGVEGDEDEDEDVNDDSTANIAVASMESQSTMSMGNKIVDVAWRGNMDEVSTAGNVLTLDATGQLSQWDIGFGTAQSTRKTQIAWKGEPAWNLSPRLAWDPHNVHSTAVTAGVYVNVLDWRASEASATTETSFRAHRYGVMDVDYNPNKPHVMTTAGQDGLVKYWDLRHVSQPLLTTRGAHRHWVSRVLYNPFHDQLVLSTGTDSLVNLWRISSISSAPLLTLDDDDADNNNNKNCGGSGPNVRIARQEHSDSVYTATWGISDAWIYATAGYDGKVTMNQVPSNEKYKILL